MNDDVKMAINMGPQSGSDPNPQGSGVREKSVEARVEKSKSRWKCKLMWKMLQISVKNNVKKDAMEHINRSEFDCSQYFSHREFNQDFGVPD